MAWLNRIFRKSKKELRNTVHQSVVGAIRALPNEKQTEHRWEKQWFLYDGKIERNEYRSKNVMNILKIIRDLNPDASMAVWNFLRLANNGHDVSVMTPNGKPEKNSTELLRPLAQRVGKLYGGGADQLINVLLLTGITQGALALEVELNEDLSDVVDFHAVDPSTLDFVRMAETGKVELVQYQSDGTPKILNQETVFYYPIDPDIGDPHGRSPILPILQIVFFQIEVLKDLKKVIHHQGYDRFDIEVVEEAILQNLPPHIASGSPEDINAYVQSYIRDVQEQMAKLEPDDDFYHTSSVKISSVGTNKNVSLSAQGVIDIINQQIVTSLKQLPILLGRNEGTTETHGTIQWQIYVAGIESIRRGIKRLLEKAYNVALQVHGKQRYASVEFHPIRVDDRQAEAQAEKLETETKILQYKQGWIDNNEAANEMVGHDAVSDPIPESNPALNPFRPSRMRRVEGKLKANEPAIDEFVAQAEDSWAEDLGRLAEQSFRAFTRYLKAQRDMYMDRLKNSEELPTRILLYIQRQRSFQPNREPGEPLPRPSKEFTQWVEANILYDSERQMEMWHELGMEWIQQAAFLAGEATMTEIGAGVGFDFRDERLITWLSERSRRNAELIQGVTDEEVMMTLWDVVYEGDFTMDQAAEKMEEAYAFTPERARTIARTEILSAGRAGQYYADVQSGMVIGKKWRAADQSRTREGHRKADGQIVAIDEPFLVATGAGQLEAMLFPGDTSLGASASNVIMCRCWYKRILEGEELE